MSNKVSLRIFHCFINLPLTLERLSLVCYALQAHVLFSLPWLRVALARHEILSSAVAALTITTPRD
jgi:hypothetical protein